MTQLKDSMTNIEKIRQEIERRKKYTHDWLRGDEKRHPKQTAISKNYYKMRGDERTLDALLAFIDSLPEDASCVYDTNKLTPTPSANIEDVARVQFALHAKVFDKKRKAVFDWEQFKEVAGIFYGFGKRDSMPEEKPSEDFPTSDEEMAKFLATHPKVEVPEKYKTPNWLFDKQPEDLEEAAEKYSDKYCSDWAYRLEYEDAFIAGAEWMRKKDVEDMYMSDNRHFLKCYEQGKVDMKVKMMNDAVEGYVAQRVHGELYAKAKVPESMNLKFGDKVKIVIIKGND